MGQDDPTFYPLPTSRRIPEESADIYPGLCVHDDRVTGAVTIGCTRWSLEAIIHTLVTEGWQSVVETYGPIEWSPEEAGSFLSDLFQARGEFARLLLEIAAAEHHAREPNHGPWWCQPELRERMRAQLERCLESLNRAETWNPPPWSGSDRAA